MKVVIFKAGLGNQLFQYNLYCKLKEEGYNVSAINFCNNHHNGFEVTKYFKVDIKFTRKFMIWVFFKICTLPYKIRKHILIDEHNFHIGKFTLFYNDYWQDKKYFPNNNTLSFKKIELNEQNKNVLELIKTTNSVSIHIRRGDYLIGGNTNVFVNLSETDYYKESIDRIYGLVETPTFFVFSNDIDWCKENIRLKRVQYIDWNNGDDSIYDMYLMSKCKYNIIANSTFSYWAALLNKNSVTIYPQKWFKNQRIDIFPKDWIAI